MRWIKFIFKLIGRLITYSLMLVGWAIICGMFGSMSATSLLHIMQGVGGVIIGLVGMFILVMVLFGIMSYLEWSMSPPLLEKKNER